MDERQDTSADDSSADRLGAARAASPWPRIVLVLGVALIVAAAAVAGVALWPRDAAVPVNTDGAGGRTTPPAPSPTPVADSTDADLTPAELANRFGDATWLVQAEGCGYEATGTAFAVGARKLITNAHVVENDAAPIIVSRDGAVFVQAVVAGADHDLDVAVLVVDEDLPGESLSWAGADELSEGQGLVALGYPVPDSSFTVTPATVMSFQSEGRTRQALRLDGLIDKGNSGGPALTATGQVAGVVTELLNSGYQLIAVAYTYDYLAEAIRTIERDRTGLVVDCTQPPSLPTVPDSWDWDDEFDWDVTGPNAYGDDPDLDRLYEACRDGDMAVCDDLYWQSPFSSEYESFAASCGGTQTESMWGSCSWSDDWDIDDWDEWDSSSWDDEPIDYGDDVYLDGLWDRCAAGDLVGCDTLYLDSPIGSAYESFGADCGGHVDEPWPGMCVWDE